jgi:hypothetical protein
MPWQVKVDEESKAPVVVDGTKIVFINPDGEELPLDPPAMYEKISEMGKNNQKDRERFVQLRDKFSVFKDVEDIAKWKEEADKAIETVTNFNDKDWMKAEKVEKLKSEMSQAYEEKLKAKDASIADIQGEYKQEIEKKDQQIRRLLVSNKFAVSKYFNGKDSKTLLPPDMAEAYFGKHIRVETLDNGDIVTRAYYSNGDLIRSKLNPGEPADFEEAMGFIIDQYPGKDQVLRSTSGGSGGSGGAGEASPTDEISKLKKQYEAAQKAGDARLSITLKNRLFEAQRKAG